MIFGIQEYTEMMKAVWDQATDGVVVCDGKGETLYQNEAARRLVPAPEKTPLRQALLDALRDARSHAQESRVARGNGSEGYVRFSALPLVDAAGAVVGAVGLAVDMTSCMEEVRRQTQMVNANMREVVFPLLRKLKTGLKQRRYLELLRVNLEKITSPFGSRLAEENLSLTPREIDVAGMIRDGLTSKEIAGLLNISQQTVDKHRKNIRKKLKLTDQKINLTTYLRHLNHGGHPREQAGLFAE